jgi:hypothetical protein
LPINAVDFLTTLSENLEFVFFHESLLVSVTSIKGMSTVLLCKV